MQDGWALVVILVRFGELALKSRFVRRRLRDRLIANIQDMFAVAGVECVTEADEARIYVHTTDPATARGILGRVFGIVSMSPAEEAHADLESLRTLAVTEASRILRPGASFALRTRRAGTHPFTSLDLAREIGAAIQRANPGVRVDLSNPDVEIYIEARQNRGFVFREIWPGPGGLPVGSQGRALAVVEDEAGLVSAWMAMKRGCRITVVVIGAESLAEPLRRWDTHLKVLAARSADELLDMAKIARAEAIFLGTRGASFDADRRPRLPIPVFDPVVALSDSEIEALAGRIRAA